jgi:2-polyprenyl-3-methyl-5-hydroxy-6-metoxy-1,4-benzoquinol methylase
MADYTEKIKKEAEFWGKETRSSLKHGLPSSVDYRHGTKLKREDSPYWDDPELDNFVRGKYRRRIIRDALEAGPEALDLCCGNGWLSLELARSGSRVTGMDVSEERIDVANKYARSDSSITGAVEFLAGDLNHAGFEEGRYDVVTAWDGLHHILKSDRLVGEIHRALKPGGQLIFFESLNHKAANERIAKLCWFILPGRKSCFYKLKLLLRKIFTRKEKSRIQYSPFEDVTGIELVDYVKGRFSIVIREDSLSILPIIAGSFDFSSGIQRLSLKLLRFVDSVLLRLGLLRGQYVYLVAVKE